METARDSQRARFYRAQWLACGAYGRRAFDSWSEVEALWHAVMRSRWLAARYPAAAAAYRLGSTGLRRGRGARGGRAGIAIPDWGWTPWIVLHEIAHCCVAWQGGWARTHGVRFAGVYLRLVTRFLGRDAARLLRQSYVRAGVRFIERAGRTLTPEQREAAVRRLAEARAKAGSPGDR